MKKCAHPEKNLVRDMKRNMVELRGYNAVWSFNNFLG